MAQLAIAAAGAALGAATLGAGVVALGMTGGAIGWAAGSVLGGLLTAPTLEGPRVDDTAVQISSYGLPVPDTYGNDRVSCPMIWAAPMVEVKKTERAGKGGPKTTTYSYTCSFAVLVNGRRVKGIRRMWHGGNLVYDARPDASLEVKAQSAKMRAFWTLYEGTETQLPDATIEAVEGAGNAPAYRGTAYIVFDDLPCNNGVIPVVSVELATEVEEVAADLAPDGTVREPLRIYPWTTTADGRPIHSLGLTFHQPFTAGFFNEPGSNDWDTAARTLARAFSTSGMVFRPDGGRISYTWPGAGYWYASDNPLMNFQNFAPGWPRNGAVLETSPEVVYTKTAPFVPSAYPDRSYPLSDARMVWPRIDLASALDGDDCMLWSVVDGDSVPPSWNMVPRAGHASIVYTQIPLGGSWVYRQYAYWMLTIGSTRVAFHPPKTCRPGGDPCTAPEGYVEVQGEPGLCVGCGGDVVPNRSWTIVTGTAKQLCGITYRAGRLYQNALGPVLLPADPNYNNAAFWAAEAAAAVAAGTLQPDVPTAVVVTQWAESAGTGVSMPSVAAAGDGTVKLSAIVADLCLAAGLQAGQIDVTELVDDVIGYTRTTRTAARAAIEPLRAAYFFDAVESGEKIVFRKRGRAVVASIGADDLGAGEEQGLEQAMSHERGQGTELPDAVAVRYKALSLDYQPGLQHAQRRAGESMQQSTLEVPVVMTDDHARQVAEVMLVQAWRQRTQRSLDTTLKYAAVEPGDVIEVDDAV